MMIQIYLESLWWDFPFKNPVKLAEPSVRFWSGHISRINCQQIDTDATFKQGDLWPLNPSTNPCQGPYFPNYKLHFLFILWLVFVLFILCRLFSQSLAAVVRSSYQHQWTWRLKTVWKLQGFPVLFPRKRGFIPHNITFVCVSVVYCSPKVNLENTNGEGDARGPDLVSLFPHSC